MSKLAIVAAVVFSAFLGLIIGRVTLNSSVTEAKGNEGVAFQNQLREIIAKNKIERIDLIGEEIAIVQKLEEPMEPDSVLSSGNRLTIFDPEGKVVYEYKDFRIEQIRLARLRNTSEQLIITTNGGGTDNYLKILDRADRKFTEMDPPLQIQYRGGWWIMPEYRSGKERPYFEPPQLIAIEQIGGADSSPSASVYRNRSGKFQKAGEISMQRIGDAIEKELNKSEPVTTSDE